MGRFVRQYGFKASNEPINLYFPFLSERDDRFEISSDNFDVAGFQPVLRRNKSGIPRTWEESKSKGWSDERPAHVPRQALLSSQMTSRNRTAEWQNAPEHLSRAP